MADNHVSDVTDVRSNPKDQIAHAAELLRRSPLRRKVFLAIYRGKRKVKSVTDLMSATKLDRITVLKQGRVLADNRIVKQLKLDGETGYEKDRFYGQRRGRILSLATNKKALERFPTKTSPRLASGVVKLDVIRVSRSFLKISRVTIDDFDTFSRVKRKGSTPVVPMRPPREDTFKRGVQRIVREPGKFTDWGGEKNDLFSTRLKLNGRRMHAAFAFKGKGQRVAKLTPKHMGKNGNQIQSLFSSPAQVFLLQYWREIDQSVLEQMQEFAKAKSVSSGERIYYGIIDGNDSVRLISAYPSQFKRTKKNS